MIKTSLSIDRSHTHGKTLRPTPSIVNIYSIDMTKYQEAFSAESQSLQFGTDHRFLIPAIHGASSKSLCTGSSITTQYFNRTYRKERHLIPRKIQCYHL